MGPAGSNLLGKARRGARTPGAGEMRRVDFEFAKLKFDPDFVLKCRPFGAGLAVIGLAVRTSQSFSGRVCLFVVQTAQTAQADAD